MHAPAVYRKVGKCISSDMALSDEMGLVRRLLKDLRDELHTQVDAAG